MNNIYIQKRLLLFVPIFFIAFSSSYAQQSVTIGGDQLKDNAILWLNGSGSQGLLLPAVSSTNNVSSPDAGLVVYQTSDNKIYYYNGSAWAEVGAGGSTGGNTYTLQYDEPSNQLTLLENGNPGTAISLSNDATSLNGLNLPSGAPGTDQILVFNGSAWEYQDLPSGTFSGVLTDATLNGDGTAGNLLGVNTAGLNVDDADADATNEIQTISFDNGTNVLSLTEPGQPDQTVDLSSLSGGSALTAGTGIDITAGVVSNTGDLDGNDDMLIATYDGNANSVVDNAENTLAIDGVIVDMSTAPVSGQVLKFIGGVWVPEADLQGSGGTLPTLTDAQIITSSGADNPIAVTVGGALTMANDGGFALNNDVVVSGTIADNEILNDDINNAANIDVTKLAAPGGPDKGILITSGTTNGWLTTANANRVFGTDLTNTLVGRAVTLSTSAAVDNTGIRGSGTATDANLVSEAAVREALDAIGGSPAWNLSGNTGTTPGIGSDFIGTLDGQDLVFGTNNTERLRVAASVPTVTDNLITIPTLLGRELRFEGGSNADVSSSTQFNIESDALLTLSGSGVDITGNVSINGTTRDVSLDITGTDAIRIPVGSTAQRPSPAGAGMLRFNSTTISYEGFDGSTWTSLGGSNSSWSLTGNDVDDAINFVGTSADDDLVFRRNNALAGRLATDATAFGVGALPNLSNLGNSAYGVNAMNSNSSGFNNVAFGAAALQANTSGADNAAFGNFSLGNNDDGGLNTAFGGFTLSNNVSGASNVAVGYNALSTNVNATDNTAIGFNADIASDAITNSTVIGSNAVVDASFTVRLGADGTGVEFNGELRPGGAGTAGASGQVLTSQGPGVAPVWAAVPGGGSLQGAYDGGSAITMAAAQNLAIETSTSFPILTLDEANNRIGIGTEAPSETFEVVSTGTAIAGSTNSNVSGDFAISGINSGTGDVAGFFFASNPVGGPDSHGVYGQADGQGAGVFGANNGTAGVAARFWTLNSGNANPTVEIFNSGTGINLYSDGAIQIQDGTEAAGRVLTSDADGLASWQAVPGGGSLQGAYDGGSAIIMDGTNEFSITTSALNPLFFTDDANAFIGIGTGTPSSKLQVGIGNIQLDFEQSLLAFDPTDVFTYQSKSVPQYSTGWYIDADTPPLAQNWISAFAGVKIFTNGLHRFSVAQSGNVGIGDIIPSDKLDVDGNINVSVGSGLSIGNVRFLSGSTTNDNILLGGRAGDALSTGTANVLLGTNSGTLTNNAIGNTFVGNNTGLSNTTGSENLFLGSGSGDLNETGSSNTFVGPFSGTVNVGGSGNTLVGYNANVSTGGLTNAIAIGANATVNSNNRMVLGASGTNIQFDGELRPADNAGTSGQVLTSQGSNNAPVWTTISGSNPTLQEVYSNGESIAMTPAVGDITISTTTTPRTALFIQESTGYVGLGTTSPGSGLTVSGDALWGSSVGITNTNASRDWRLNVDNSGVFQLTQANGATFTPLIVNDRTITMGDIGGGVTDAFLRIDGDNTGNLEYNNGTVWFEGSNGATPTSGAGTRFMWIPSLRAVRAGSVGSAEWDEANIGSNSVAFGSGNTASGANSSTFGSNNVSSGNNSTTIGQATTASGFRSFAGGVSSTASGNGSTALGEGVTASTRGGFAVGHYNIGGGSATSFTATDPVFEIGIGANAGSPANAVTVLHGGNVGVGTATPENLFHLFSSTSSPILKIDGPLNGAGLDPTLRLTETFGTDFGFDLYLDGDQNTLKFRSIETDATAVDNILTMTRTDGNVGIGVPTASSFAKLHTVKSIVLDGDAAIYGGSSQTYQSGFYGALAYDQGPSRFGVFAHSDALANTLPLGVNRGADGALIGFLSAGVQEGSISVSGNTVVFNAFTGVHFGLSNQPIERGMLVTLTGDNSYYHGNPNSEIIHGIEKSQKANDPKIMGAYLNVEEPSRGRSIDNPELIMAVGNGDMWVVENGYNLEAGDYLISSDVPGYAMRDNGDYDVANVIARVSEPVNWEEVDEYTNGRKRKKIMVFFESFVRNHKADRLEKEVADLRKEIEDIKSLLSEKAAVEKSEESGNNALDELAVLKAQVEMLSRLIQVEAKNEK